MCQWSSRFGRDSLRAIHDCLKKVMVLEHVFVDNKFGNADRLNSARLIGGTGSSQLPRFTYQIRSSDLLTTPDGRLGTDLTGRFLDQPVC